MARVRVLTMKFPRVTKIGQSIASMRTTPQVSGLGAVTVYIARFKCRAGLDPDRAYLFQLGSAHQKVAPGRARSTRLHCHLFCRAVLDPGRALSICGSVNVAYGICSTCRGALAGTRSSSVGPPWRIDPTTHRTTSERFYHGATYVPYLSVTTQR